MFVAICIHAANASEFVRLAEIAIPGTFIKAVEIFRIRMVFVTVFHFASEHGKTKRINERHPVPLGKHNMKVFRD